MVLLTIACIILGVAVLVLLIKIYAMQKSMDEICESVKTHLSSDTNRLVTVSTDDRHVRRLAEEISTELSVLRRQRQRYLNGDRELKEAVTNISHDLRTPLTAICGYLDLLERQDKNEAVTRYLACIGDRVEVLKALTEELFRYSVILSTEGEMTLEPISLCGAIEESIAAFYGALCLCLLYYPTLYKFSFLAGIATIYNAVGFQHKFLYYRELFFNTFVID